MKLITQSSQRKASLVQGPFTLPVLAGTKPLLSSDKSGFSVLSPYFQSTVPRKIGKQAGLTKLTQKEMKAIIVEHAGLNTSEQRLQFFVDFFDESDGSVDGSHLEVLVLTSEFDSLAELNAAVEADILAEASSRSYTGFTAKDIIWSALGTVQADVASALAGHVSPQIDGKTVGNTTIFSNNSGRDFLVTEYFVNAVNVSGLGTAPIINIGSNPSNYNDVATSLSLSFANQAGKFTKKQPDNNQTLVSSGDSLVCRVATAAILTTTYDFRVFVRGVYLN